MNTIQFNLASPLPYLNSKIEKGQFKILYPENKSSIDLLDQHNNIAMTCGYDFPQEVIDQWTDSDQVLIDHLLEMEPWLPKPIEIIEPKESTDSEPTQSN